MKEYTGIVRFGLLSVGLALGWWYMKMVLCTS